MFYDHTGESYIDRQSHGALHVGDRARCIKACDVVKPGDIVTVTGFKHYPDHVPICKHGHGTYIYFDFDGQSHGGWYPECFERIRVRAPASHEDLTWEEIARHI